MGVWSKVATLFGARRPEPAANETEGSADPPRAESPAPASPEEAFRAEVMRIAEAAPFIASVSAASDAYALDLTYADGEQMKCFLGNLYAETRDVSPEERQLRVLHFLSVMSERPELPETWDDAAEMLLPVLRPSTFFQHGLGPDEPGKQPVRRPFLPFLSEALAIDHESAMAYAIVENLETWGVDAERAHARALENLQKVGDRGIELYDPTAAYRIWHVVSGDTYESSRLLLPGWLASFRDRVAGRPVAAVPERSTLLVTGDGDPAAIERLIASADREFRAAPRSISPALYTVDDGGRVVPYDLPSDHPLHGRIHEGQVHLAAVEYGSQKEKLQAEIVERGEDVFVATYSVVQRESDGRVVSYCTWGENVDSLLPRTDLVGFVGGDFESGSGWHFLVPWEVVAREAAACWREAPEVEPPRMRTLSWPGPELLATLRRHEVGG
jgi:hypothetical protein